MGDSVYVKTCSAAGCNQRIFRRLLMCPHHWKMVPHELRDQIIITLDDLKSGVGARAYFVAVTRAQLAVARNEEQPGEVIRFFEDKVKRYAPVPEGAQR